MVSLFFILLVDLFFTPFDLLWICVGEDGWGKYYGGVYNYVTHNIIKGKLNIAHSNHTAHITKIHLFDSKIRIHRSQ